MTKPIPDSRYHSLPDSYLHYIIKDAGEAAKLAQAFDTKAECKYLDQVNDACTILAWRRRTDEVLAARQGRLLALAA